MLAHTAGNETAAAGASRLAKIRSAHEAADSLRRQLQAHAEWLYVRDGRRRASARRDELEFRSEHGSLIFYCLSDEGREVWRIIAWGQEGEKLLFEARRGAGREQARLELIPRISARVLAEEVSASRRSRLARLARLACAQLPGAAIERAGLSAGAGFNQPGPFARILLKRGRTRVAVTGVVSDAQARRLDALLSSTLLWFLRLTETSRAPLDLKLWMTVERPCVEALRQRAALLGHDISGSLSLYEVDADYSSLMPVDRYELEELFALRQPRISSFRFESSETAASITALAPEAIDVVRARRGETLRFHGLPFARVRRVLNQERLWFGLDSSKRRMLDDRNVKDFERLLDELIEHRQASSTSRQHALYKHAPEAWLESILRRDITRLDPGLRLSPLHAQFRAAGTKAAASRPVDLLALRRDGRLVVIELKVSEDREHVLQAADYWRRVEAYRRQGAIKRARLFGDAQISDEPPLVYLVAPALSFHRSFRRLAQMLRTEIELYRFDLNEDWRAGVRVIRRERAN